MTEAFTDMPADVNFFRNFNRVVGIAFLAIVILTLGFFAYQINEKRKEELALIEGHMVRHSQFIEFVLRSSLDYLEALRSVAESHYRRVPTADTHTKATPTAPHALRALLRQRQDRSSFDLDLLPDRDSGGNLTGLGSLQGRSASFYRDLDMALDLNQTFFLITFNLPSAAEASFVSVDNFATSSPWQESKKRQFSPQVYQQPIWRLGTPQYNARREKYWAPVHYGGKEAGMLVPAGAPVYQQDEFRGVVSIDTSLDYLNRVNADFGYPLGTVMLVDAQGAVLAHPNMLKTALEQQSTQTLTDVLPANLQANAERFSQLPNNQAVELGDFVVIKHSFVSAPWQLVYLVPQRTLWLQMLQNNGGAMLVMFLGLTSLIVVMYTVTAKEFVVPATKLVQHLAAESQFHPRPVPVVPFPWRPWFETVSKAFRESLQLMSLRQELDIAANMQQAILPRHWPDDVNFALWGTMRSAKEVGGDFYDHFALGAGKTGIVVADVSGKGVPAALFGMVSKTLLRATATQNTPEPGPVMASVNDGLCHDNDTCMFVTVFYAVFDALQGSLTYVNGGHPPPLLIHANGTSEFLPLTDGIALGVADGLPFSQHTIRLTVGDTLLIYTDGVTEAFNPGAEEFTQERLPGLFAQTSPAGVHDVVNRTVQAVDRFAAGAPQSDDITCVALCFHPQQSTQALAAPGGLAL